jgi:hypothetical protein
MWYNDLAFTQSLVASTKSPAYVILPRDIMTAKTLLNPFRHNLQNWQQQSLFHVCIGNPWGRVAAFRSYIASTKNVFQIRMQILPILALPAIPIFLTLSQ